MTKGSKLSHLGEDGSASMVDVGNKAVTTREAIAVGQIKMTRQTLMLIREGDLKKGDVIGTARLAGIMAAKQTSNLIPLCHPLLLSKIAVEIEEAPELPGLRVKSTVRLSGQTGVEMEALTACSITCLTIYDMAKAVDKGMEIGGIRLLKKTGGKSGDWVNDSNDDLPDSAST